MSPLDSGHAYVQSATGRRRAKPVVRLSLDYETYSEAQLVGTKSVGGWEYSVHPTTEVLMVAYRLGGRANPIVHVDLTQEPFPDELADALCDPLVEKWGFNASFERLITKNVLHLPTPYEGWRCTMALANMQSFTGDLFEVGTAMGLDGSLLKSKEGSRLIRLFCGPQRVTKNQPHARRTRETDPVDWERFCEYNTQDVVAEDGIADKLIRFDIPEDEWVMYEVDQRINDRGLPVNRRFVEQAQIKSDARKEELFWEMLELTGLTNPNSTGKLLPWLQDRGYPFADLQKATVSKVLNLDKEEPILEPDARQALRIRRFISQTSVKKFPAILRRLSEDNNLRHTLQYGGAARTLRWAGRGPQPHNLTKTPKLLEADENGDWSRLIICADIIENGTYSDLQMYLSEPMVALAGSVRSSFQAHPGYQLVVCDLKAIESAVIAWLSGCTRMLDVFTNNRDPYRDFGVELFRKRYEDITSAERNICKPAVLGCFAADTPVLTERGWVPIVEVTSSDRVFDGAEFVGHAGVVYRGVKDVIGLYGVRVTPEHLVMVEENVWEEACLLLQNTAIENRALCLAYGKLSVLCDGTDGSTTNVGVNAGLSPKSISKILNSVKRNRAYRARKKCAERQIRTSGNGFLKSIRTMLTGSRVVFMRSNRGVARRSLWHLNDTMIVGLNVGSIAPMNLSSIASLYRATMTHVWNSTVKTTTDIMRSAIYGLSREDKIIGIKKRLSSFRTMARQCVERSFGKNTVHVIGTLPRYSVSYASALLRRVLSKSNSEPESVEVFDVVNAGPRQRFTILTDRGPLIVHNCAYQLGGGKLKDGKRTGLWGYAENMGVNITQAEASEHVRVFRETYPQIPELWNDLDYAARSALVGRPTTVNGKLRFAMDGPYLTVQLPSGRKMYYYRPRIVDKEFEGKDGTIFTRRVLSYMGKNQFSHQWGRTYSSPGKQAENVTQATAREILAIGIRRAHDVGFNIVGSVHDEIICHQRIGDNEFTLERLRECMIGEIAWATGLPLGASGYVHSLYRKD